MGRRGREKRVRERVKRSGCCGGAGGCGSERGSGLNNGGHELRIYKAPTIFMDLHPVQ